MKRNVIVFTEPGKAELQAESFNPELQADQIIVETEVSVLSAGTELAILSGNEWWAPLPNVPGYGNIGRITEKGEQVSNFEIGDRVFTYASHASHTVWSVPEFTLAAPSDIAASKAVMGRMAQVAMTAPRVSNVELGDYVVVQGLGLVGNLAAQFMHLQGATVIGIDLSNKRLETAKACGIDYVINPNERDPIEAVKEITAGRMAETVVEATGVPDLAIKALKMAGKNGECILLGTPRGNINGDPMEILSSTHLWGRGCITMKGAHEWRFPRMDQSDGTVKHSIERNVRIFWDMLRQGRIHVDALISHVESPANCNAVYNALNNRDENYGGVIWDWTTL